MKEETLKILEMVENHTLTAQQGMEMLEALENAAPADAKQTARWLHIKVRPKNDNVKDKVNIKVPVSVAKIAMKIGSAFSFYKDGKTDISAADIGPALEEMLANGETGELMNVDADDELVLITLE